MVHKYNYTIKPQRIIFRYDLQEPPKNWDSDYHSLEYILGTMVKGISNTAQGMILRYTGQMVRPVSK